MIDPPEGLTTFSSPPDPGGELLHTFRISMVAAHFLFFLLAAGAADAESPAALGNG